MKIQGQEITYQDLKHRPELWPVVEAHVAALREAMPSPEELRVAAHRLDRRGGIKDVPRATSLRVLADRIEAAREGGA